VTDNVSRIFKKYKDTLTISLSIIALIVSVVSLWNSYTVRLRSRTPNVQLWDITTTWLIGIEDTDGTSKLVAGSEIDLKNVGDASTQITDVKWEDRGSERFAGANVDFIITDLDLPSTNEGLENFIQSQLPAFKDDPLNGFEDKLIRPNEQKHLEIIFIIPSARGMSSGGPPVQEQIYNTVLVFVTISFSDGKSLTFSPLPVYFYGEDIQDIMP